ncbi:alpha-E domain-containing protein [Acinetobacter junii]|uniref:alpha-E domain-containing protein n=1 Tax=Acinetobacter junii TaxID=40215 RepID=UPI00057AA295|nr:alpha-E domain-containing protein [Acinetobacter junii]
MTLLSSSAQHVYWLGRYLFRIGYVAEQLPFVDDQKAEVFAQGLCLHIEDAENLNQFMLDEKQPYSLINQLEIARNNIQELRALFSATAYAELNTLIKNATNTPDMILELVQDCREILKNEKEEVFLFFHLGQSVEQIDTHFRFHKNIHSVIDSIDPMIVQLSNLGWSDLQHSWNGLKDQPYLNQFYEFTYKLENQFEVYA